MTQQLKSEFIVLLIRIKQFFIAILSARAGMYINQESSKEG